MKQTRDRQVYIIAAVLAVLTFAAFRQVLKCDFINLDDNLHVTENFHLNGGLSVQNVRWAFTTLYQAFWMPLVWLSYLVDHQIWGLNALGYHLTNLLFHIANVLLLFFILKRMTKSTWKSAFVAALFAVHPLHVESVAWVTERKDVVSAFFWMLTMWAYVRYVEHPTWKRYVLVFSFLLLGLMSKTALVTMPFVLLLLDYWPLRRLQQAGRAWRLALEKLPLLPLVIGSTAISFIAQKQTGAISPLNALPMAWRVENALVSYSAYLVKTVWPTKLAVFYPHPLGTLPAWQIVGSTLLLALITILVLRAREKRPYLMVGWLWYLGTLLPMIGIVQFGQHAMADRFTYVPLIGIFVMITWGIGDLLTPGRLSHPHVRALSAAPAIAAGLVLAVLSALTWIQVGYWRDSGTLFTHAIRVTRNNPLAHISLGCFLGDRGDWSGEVRECREAIHLDPTDSFAHNDLGVALTHLGRTEEAETQFEAALVLDPENNYIAHVNLGVALAKKGDLQGAADHLEEAIRLDPNPIQVRMDLAAVLGRQGKLEEATQQYREIVKANPNSAAAYYNLGLALERQRKLDETIEAYQHAIGLKPDYPQAHKNLAIALYFKGDFAGAWREVHQCLKYGGRPHPGFVQALSKKMRDPGR